MTIPCDEETVRWFRRGGSISGTGALGGFAFDLDTTLPYVVTAIHAGHRVRRELLPLMQISETGRRFEEDTATDRIIARCGSTISALDSRSEYDLNRPEHMALPLTPDRFWGTKVYRTSPNGAMNKKSLEKYEDFYRFVGSYLHVIVERFGYCVVYDVHSYNLSRQVEKGFVNPPLFNLGTVLLDMSRWGNAVRSWRDLLSRIAIPGQAVNVEENMVFHGKGAFCGTLTGWDPKILVLPTEISKIYMDEHTGSVDDNLVTILARELSQAVKRHRITGL